MPRVLNIDELDQILTAAFDAGAMDPSISARIGFNHVSGAAAPAPATPAIFAELTA